MVMAGLLVAATIGAVWWNHARRQEVTPPESVVQTIEVGDLRIALTSPEGLHQGHNRFGIEFRSEASGALVDAGVVHLAATMTMPGMVMSGGVEVVRTTTRGRYVATGDFGMSGVWQMVLQWEGAGRRGSTSFQGRIQ